MEGGGEKPEDGERWQWGEGVFQKIIYRVILGNWHFLLSYSSVSKNPLGSVQVFFNDIIKMETYQQNTSYNESFNRFLDTE